MCSYLDFQRGKQERVVCVSEYYQDTLRDKVFNTDDQPIEEVLEAIARQVLNALHYLEDRNVIVLKLSSNNIVFDTKQEVKLFNFGMGHMSEYGKLGMVCIGDNIQQATFLYNKSKKILDQETAKH